MAQSKHFNLVVNRVNIVVFRQIGVLMDGNLSLLFHLHLSECVDAVDAVPK